MYQAEILADSMSPEGMRLTTLRVTYPHSIHKDVMTHRAFSRSFQSFRAYPPEKVIETIERDPFIPESFDTRIKGMGQGEALGNQREGLDQWMRHIENSLTTAREFISMDVAKAQVNFVLQDLTWITGIITATEWDNFFALRLATDQDGKPLARPEVYKIAHMMREAIDHSQPAPIRHDGWHLPLVDNDKLAWDKQVWSFISNDMSRAWDYWKMISVGRCARVSYLTHDGQRDAQKDIELHDRLMQDGHMSPFEHIARPFSPGEWYTISEMERAVSESDNSIQSLRQLKQQQMINQCRFSGNFFGWHQYRKDINYEDNFAEMERLINYG
jgi:thymidylate synthase ThyX